jgi:TolB-like protein
VVVPSFVDASTERNLSAFCAGLTREVTRRLAGMKSLRVVVPHLPTVSTAAFVVKAP